MSARRRRRNAVLAPMTRWLWWSPWRMLLATVVTFAVVGVVAHVATRSSASGVSQSCGQVCAQTPAGQPTEMPTGSAPSSTDEGSSVDAGSSSGSVSPMPTQVTTTAVPPAAARSSAGAVAAATGWVTLWARPQLSPASWRTALVPTTYVEYARQLVTVDPARVPANRLGKTQPSVLRFAPAAAHVRVPVAGGSIRAVDVTLIFYPVAANGRWLVNDLAPVG